MLKRVRYALPCLLLAACGETPEKYRDTHHLELPPVLPIEHTNPQPALDSDDLKPKSALAGLMTFTDGDKPLLTLKTREERAWEMIATALKITDIEILDKNQQDGRFQVRYDPDTAGKDLSLIRTLLNNHYAEAEYLITLQEQTGGIRVNAALAKPEDMETDEDGSAELLRLLHKTIDEKILNRNPQAKPEN
ncbi:outer membrane protein assembly factor BamC [Methylomonas sp. EFPC3]|uniref:outer membrane protein assembly factor BamC n=1 Tax=Methylomonas sp. EFPC3 TaxID=3021710 RepID=UPI0024159F77|nr:outer membrane protein assembly factor BamC [Methylomonas sp. EFPC3]WFP48965.1 outer membrane protein assembly factor BamC [Methylomonas sp. EFPC3]